ncbi:serine/threonine protein kinase [Nonomuraea sp. NN258]|uniref:serine/threonine protein kinase n=1 Tax=Nonomuraea antri TaxID=2730852 RepID=UPI00156984E5|nr:serine/threonine-protein kinase [Nonomuraea antri]NRQ33933.1 serine/threonine protein kinase [Nonomuraea antri]
MIEPLRADDPQAIGPYRLVYRLGAGGMGTVYGALDERGRRVAVKLIHRELAQDPEFRARFAREIAMLDRVDGAFTARLLATDPHAAQPWAATEYVPGPTLAQHIADTGSLPEQELMGLAAGLAEALRALHAVNVVHRDLKPSNVILSPTGPQLIDMGIARALDETSVTRTGVVVGSPGWISPDEFRGERLGPATDVYGWGLLVLHAATGRLPYGTGRPEVLAFRVLSEDPAHLQGLPKFLRGLVTQALSKNPDERPQVAAILRELTKTGTDKDIVTEEVTRLLERTWIMPNPVEPQWVVPAPPHTRRLLVPAVVSVVLALVIAGGAIVVSAAQTPVGVRNGSLPEAAPFSSVSPTVAVTPATAALTPERSVTEKLAQTGEGYAFRLPSDWKTTNEFGASGGETCAFPADSKGCESGGIRISYGVEPDEHFSLDDTNLVVRWFCPAEEGAYAGMDERELRQNAAYKYEYRSFRVTCAHQPEFTVFVAYFPDADHLIRAFNVPKKDVDAAIGSFAPPDTPADTVEDSPGYRQALAIDELLDASEKTRKKVSTSVNRISSCKKADASFQSLQEASDERQTESMLVAPAGGSPLEVDALPNGEELRLRLYEALNASYTASVHYALWARWYIHAGCQETNNSEPSYRSALAHSNEATRHKKAFVKMWYSIAREYDLKARTAGKI